MTADHRPSERVQRDSHARTWPPDQKMAFVTTIQIELNSQEKQQLRVRERERERERGGMDDGQKQCRATRMRGRPGGRRFVMWRSIITTANAASALLITYDGGGGGKWDIF